MAYKTSKNLLQSRDTYNRYYGDFRGVDFSSDHSQVHEQRLAYSVNMFKDYGAKQGVAIETIPGFRRRFYSAAGTPVYGIHRFKSEILVHIGNFLYCVKDQAISGDAVLTLTDDEKVALLDAVGNAEYDFMNEHNSVSFVMQGNLYILDGNNFLVYSQGARARGEKSYPVIANVLDNAYIPTTYIPDVEYDSNTGVSFVKRVEHEQENLISKHVKELFYGDGETTTFALSYPPGQATIKSVCLDSAILSTDEFTIGDEGELILNEVPSESSKITVLAEIQRDYEEIADGVVINSSLITNCTMATIFDNRVFLSGNPDYPCHIFWCDISMDTGIPTPTYFGVYSHQQDGVNVEAPITGMLSVANTLMVLKSDSREDGTIYYHAPSQTGNDVIPVVYPSEQGFGGIGCLGSCANFLDDPVFISRLGLEGVGQLSVRYERAIEHRSSLVDAKLVTNGLDEASVCEWNGYLVVLTDGNIFLADSRQVFTDNKGNPQYEWYFLEGIGMYEGQTRENEKSPYEGGTFHPARIVCEIDGNMWFGTDNGFVFSFNFDQRNEFGEFSPDRYTFDGRTIFCGCATKMDCCGIPHLTKTTVKKSMVVKTKTMLSTSAKVKVRTNNKPYEQVQRISGSVLDFNNLDFGDFSFVTTDQSLHSVREKEKKWVEKQYFIYSDEYMKPFALYYIAFQYNVAGRYKE